MKIFSNIIRWLKLKPKVKKNLASAEGLGNRLFTENTSTKALFIAFKNYTYKYIAKFYQFSYLETLKVRFLLHIWYTNNTRQPLLLLFTA